MTKAKSLRDSLKRDRQPLAPETPVEASQPAAPKLTTLHIDGDLHEALQLRKAKGKGSLKDQINAAIRLYLEDAE